MRQATVHRKQQEEEAGTPDPRPPEDQNSRLPREDAHHIFIDQSTTTETVAIRRKRGAVLSQGPKNITRSYDAIAA